MDDPEFLAIWRKRVQPIIERLTKLWNKYGGQWVEDISSLSDLNQEGLTMATYKEFSELSGEEQYAFMAWLKEEHPKVKIS